MTEGDCVSLAQNVAAAVLAADKLKTKNANEANTKALVIEPMLMALGWDLADIDAVEREVKVYDGTLLDYALRVDGVARVYVEAKSISGNLDDKKFVAQAINYANNDGVLWCVLTNGIRYRVFKTNEVAAMEGKLLFEVDLHQPDQSMAQKVEQLGLIGRQSVASGDLDRYGERVFTDSRVRAVLSMLAADPPAPFLAGVASKLGSPAVPDDALRRSLDAPTASAGPLAVPPVAGGPPSPQAAVNGAAPGPGPAPKGVYQLSKHLDGKAAVMRELWEALDGYAPTLGPDVVRTVHKLTIDYYRGKKAVFSVQLRNDRVLVFVKLDPSSVQPWNPDVMRDVTNIGHQGNGHLEYSLAAGGQLDEARALIASAYTGVG